jgi:membrane fusion protein, heavy metal efflux system
VQKGQVLAVLEHPDYIALQEDFAEVANHLDFLEQEYNRQKKLFENNVGAGKDFQKVKADYNTARAKYEGLKSRLTLLRLSPEKVKAGTISNSIDIVSPINGFMNEVKIKMGTYVGAQDKLFEITDNSQIHADFMVYEKDVHLLKEGQKIHFTVANRPGEEFLATIFAIGKEFESSTRAVHIHASLDEKVSGLIPGMYITGHIHTNDHYTKALPNDAVVAEGTKSYIFVVDNDALNEIHETKEAAGVENHDAHENEHPMAFQMVEIIPGQKDENYTEIKLLDSLSSDTKVVMNAAYYLLSEMNKGETEHQH